MSNLLKSKFLLGVAIVAVMFVGVVALTPTSQAAAATCSITTTLRLGSKGTEVKCLQSTFLSLVADGSFGPKTQAAVKAWQSSVGLTADGIFGPKSRAAWAGSSSVGMTYPAGCTSGTGFSPTTGQPCTGTVTTTLPAGCTSTAGFSPLTGASCATGAVGNATGPLSVSLASDNPASGNLIQGQATADLAHFLFTGTGTLTQVTLQRSGISDNSVFPNVYLYNGNARLTDAASINSNGQIIFNGVNIAVNGSLDLSVKADITSSTTSSQSTVMVTLTGYMVSGGAAANTVSVAGNSFYINSGTGILSSVSLGATNSVANQQVSAGTTGMALWSDSVTVSLHPVLLKSAAFDVIGSAPTNALANLGLYANGVQVATSTGINSMGYIVFDLSGAPYSMPTGATTLEVRGDIVNGSARDITLSVQHASDLMVTDSQVGVNVGVTTAGTTPATFNIMQGGKISIQQGSLVAQTDPAFNSQTNVTGGASNVAIASYKLTSYGEDVKVNSVTVVPVIGGSPVACTGIASGAVALNNVTLYYNGAPVGSSQNATVTTPSGCALLATLTFTPGSNLTIAGGTTGVFQVRADLINGAGTTYSSGTIGATVVITQYQGITSGQTDSLSLSGSNTMNIQTGSVTIGTNSGYLSQAISPNTSGAEIGSFTIQNNSTSEGVQVNSIVVGLCNTGTGVTGSGTSSACATAYPTLTNISTLSLSGIPGNAPTPIGQPTVSNTFSTNFTIPAGGSQTVNVLANLGSTNTGGIVTALRIVAVGSNSRVAITPTAVAGQTISFSVGTLSTASLVSSASTNAQYISSAGTGAVNAAQETYNFVASSGTANISGLKFAALASTDASTTALTVTGGDFTTTGTHAATVASGGAAFTVGDNVLITTNGIYGGQDAVGVVTGTVTGTSIPVDVTTAMVTGSKSASSSVAADAFVIHKLATTGLTGVALNSPGVATGTAQFNNGVAYISAITGANGSFISVPNNPSGVSIPVFLSFGPVNTSGGVDSGTTAQAILMYVQYQTGSTTNYLAPTPTTAKGTVLTLVGSKPTLALNSSTQTLTNGTSVLLGTVTVTADNGGDIAISEIPLTVSLNAGSGGTPVIVQDHVKLTDTNGAPISTLTPKNSTGSTSASASEVFGDATANHYRISAGTSKTFEIRADFSGSTFNTSSTASVSLGSAATFAWDDINGGSTSDVTASNGTVNSGLTGAGLYSYPSGSVSIHN